MIITSYGLIVFQLVPWIGICIFSMKRKTEDENYNIDMLGFAYPSIPSMHEVPRETLAVDDVYE